MPYSPLGFESHAVKMSSEQTNFFKKENVNTDMVKQINYSRYKTELCRQFNENGECKYGEKCQFAHGFNDLKDVNRHPKYKTDFCKTFHSKGFCPYGPRCHFIHEINEKSDLCANPKRNESKQIEGNKKLTFNSSKSKQAMILTPLPSPPPLQFSSSPTTSPNSEQNKVKKTIKMPTAAKQTYNEKLSSSLRTSSDYSSCLSYSSSSSSSQSPSPSSTYSSNSSIELSSPYLKYLEEQQLLKSHQNDLKLDKHFFYPIFDSTTASSSATNIFDEYCLINQTKELAISPPVSSNNFPLVFNQTQNNKIDEIFNVQNDNLGPFIAYNNLGSSFVSVATSYSFDINNNNNQIQKATLTNNNNSNKNSQFKKLAEQFKQR